jgi:hypothetical protein
MKRGTDKYKCMFSLICFNFGKIDHFSSKCPYAKNLDSDEDLAINKRNIKMETR